MPVEVKKTERENSQSLIRRFTRKIKQSGVLVRARDSRFHHRSKSKEMQKRAALRKEERKIEYERLKKMGKAVK